LILTVAAWRFASFSLSVVAMLLSLIAIHAHYWTWILVPLFGAWLPRLITSLKERPHPPTDCGLISGTRLPRWVVGIGADTPPPESTAV
jgi:hypothetical protein